MGGGLGYVPSLHELSHRQIYEALSLYWHRRGRQHLLFVPAIQVSKKIYTPDTGYSVITTNKTSNILSTNQDKESYKTRHNVNISPIVSFFSDTAKEVKSPKR